MARPTMNFGDCRGRPQGQTSDCLTSPSHRARIDELSCSQQCTLGGKVDMSITGKNLRRIIILAGLAALSVCANAIMLDTHIVIDRALNSPTLTVRYTGATVALVELKVNGESIGTRAVSAA